MDDPGADAAEQWPFCAWIQAVVLLERRRRAARAVIEGYRRAPPTKTEHEAAHSDWEPDEDHLDQTETPPLGR